MDSGAVTIGLLGPLDVRRDGAALPLAGSRPGAVLAVLALEVRRVVVTERLVEALWGADAPERATTTLQVHVSRLRRVLDVPVIRSQPGGYLLDLPLDAIDAARFEQLRRDAADAVTNGDPDAAATHLEAALALWRGPALADLQDLPFAADAAARLERSRANVARTLVGLREGTATQLPPASDGAWLVPAIGEPVRLGSDAFVLGRSGSSDLTIGDKRASRRHAIVRPVGDGHEISDLGSTNGTELNGARLAPEVAHRLVEGDLIAIGAVGVTYTRKRPAADS